MSRVSVRSQNNRDFPPLRDEAGCRSCPRRRICLSGKLTPPQSDFLSTKLQRPRPVTAGQRVTSAGSPFNGIYIVRTGFFKSCLINQDGDQQITGFHLPGEIFGFEGIASGIYLHSTEALDTGAVCRIPAQLLFDTGNENQPFLQLLIKHMSQVILRDSEMIFSLSRMSAPRRLASFLIDFTLRMQQSGFREEDLMLFMSRTDIGSYLGLAEETVCRLFSCFKHRKILTIKRRNIQSYDLEKLQELAAFSVTVTSQSDSVYCLSAYL